MGLEIYPKIIGPPPMPNGGVSLPAGSGLDKWIVVRDDTDGVVVNTETLSSLELSNGKLIGGRINISHVPLIGCYMLAEFGTGPLTLVGVTPVFSDHVSNLAGYDAVGTLAAPSAGVSVVTLSKKRYNVSAELGYFFSIPNPGANYVRFYFTSTGTDTGSYVIFAVGLGWGAGNQLMQI